MFSSLSPCFPAPPDTKVEWLWTQSFPDLARPVSHVGTSRALQPEVKVLKMLNRDNVVHYCKKSDIDRWCEAVLNSGVTRMALDTEWRTERRFNNGPGKKVGKVAVISLSFLDPEAPTNLVSIDDLVPFCRVGVFQVSGLLALPERLKQLLETPTVTKTGTLCLVVYCSFCDTSHHVLSSVTRYIHVR